MAIPDYETIMLPLLQHVSDGEVHSMDIVSKAMADIFKLSAEEREQKIPSGQMTYIKNRTGWAKTYLKKAGLLESPKRGFIQISDRGRELLSSKPQKINKQLLEQFPEFIQFLEKSNETSDEEIVIDKPNSFYRVGSTGFTKLNRTLLNKCEEQLGIQVKTWTIRQMRKKCGSCNPKTKRVQLNLELAKKADIAKAKRVIFLGFDYDDTNLDRLRINCFHQEKPWVGESRYYGTAFKFNSKRVEELKREYERCIVLSKSQTIITDFLRELAR